MATQPQFASVPNTTGAQILNADGTTAKTVWTAGASGGLIQFVTLCSTNTAAVALVFELVIGATTHLLGRISIPSTTTIASLGPWTSDYLPGLPSADPSAPLEAGAVLKARVETAVASGKQIDIVAFGGDY
jgi:hypothetical protein